MNKLRVAMMTPKLKGHEDRGTGVYARQLLQALNERSDVTAEFVTSRKNLRPYDVIHYPFFDPFFLTLPFRLPKPAVVTVHDLIPFNFPQHFPVGFRGMLKWQAQRFSLSLKPALLTDSFASKNDIVNYSHIQPDFIHVIYLGVGKEFRVNANKQELANIQSILNLPKRFILYVGDINYNKNIQGLIQTFARIAESDQKLHLVLVGKGFITASPQRKEITSLIHSLNLEDRILQLGHVSIEQLVSIYNLAEVYVQPSFSEGFGLPVLEAMACGTPVVSAHTASLPEIVTDSALLVDPYNIKKMAKSIEAVLHTKQLRDDLIEKGLKHVRLFTWEKCAEETVAVYKSVCSFKDDSPS
jgi:glycosyltransferase involved in cell wall biosynthesis